jgi:hypothetical protein
MPSPQGRGHFVFHTHKSTSGPPIPEPRHSPKNRHPNYPPALHRLKDESYHHHCRRETTVAPVLPAVPSPDSPLAAKPGKQANSPALPSVRNLPAMQAAASPARASLHAQNQPTLHAQNQPSLHSVHRQTPPCSPIHAVPPHSKSYSGFPATPSEPQAPPSPSETQNYPAGPPSRTPSVSHSKAPATVSSHQPPQAQLAPQLTVAAHALHPWSTYSPLPCPSPPCPCPPPCSSPQAQLPDRQHYSTHSTNRPAAIPIHTPERTTTSPSDTAAIPTDKATPTSTPPPDRTPTLHSHRDSNPRPQDTAARTIQARRH